MGGPRTKCSVCGEKIERHRGLQSKLCGTCRHKRSSPVAAKPEVDVHIQQANAVEPERYPYTALERVIEWWGR